jgi:hypothetical protein
MLLHYCSLHTQLFIWKDRVWKDFPLAKINQIKGFGNLLRAANAASTALTVMERPCDQCTEAIRQIFQICRAERTREVSTHDHHEVAPAQSVLRRYPTPGSVTR